MKESKFELIIAIVAIIIAALSLIISTYQTSKTYELTRIHNKLSVTPHLDILKHQTKYMPHGISVLNNGIGPAKIKEFEVYLDGKKMPPNFAWWEPIIAIMKKEFTNWQGEISFGRLRTNQFVRVGDEIFLLREPLDSSDEDTKKVFINLRDRLGFLIKYESIYGEPFESKRLQNID